MPANGDVFDRRVAVAAVDAVAGDVALVAELDRLFARDVDVGHPRATGLTSREDQQQSADEENRAEDADPRNRVRAAVEDLRHRSCRCEPRKKLVELTLFLIAGAKTRRPRLRELFPRYG